MFDDVDTLGFFVLCAVLAITAVAAIIRRRKIVAAEREMRRMYGKDWG